MVVLSETPPTGFTPERVAAGRRYLHEQYGMPMAWTPLPKLVASIHGSRAVVAVRERDAWTAARRCCGACACSDFMGLALDEPAVLDRCGRREAGLDPAAVGRMGDSSADVEEALRADMRAVAVAVAGVPRPGLQARRAGGGAPLHLPELRAERTAPPPPDWPTTMRVDLPGFRPVEAYEAAIANPRPS